MTYKKEMYHSLRVKKGIPLETQGHDFGKHCKRFPKKGWDYPAYKNQVMYHQAGKA
jgi:hypothetical protein